MAIALVVSVSAQPGGNGGSTGAVDSSGGDFIVASVARSTNDGTFSDSKGNTWVPLTTKTSASCKAQLFYSFNPTVGAGHTFDYSGVNTFPTIAVAVFSGVKTSGDPFDNENGGTGAFPAATVSTGAVTPGVDNEVLVSGLGTDSGPSTAYSIDNGFTIAEQLAYSPGAAFGGALAYKILAGGSGSGVNPAWSWTGGTTSAAVIACFKPAAAAGPPPYAGFFALAQARRSASKWRSAVPRSRAMIRSASGLWVPDRRIAC